MKEKDATYQLIDRYLAGEMEAAEQTAFEDRLQQDSQLKRLLERERKIDKDLAAFLDVQGDEKLRTDLESLGEQFFEEKNEAEVEMPQAEKRSARQRKIPWYWLGGVAAASLLVTWLLWQFLLFAPAAEQLFADNLQRYPEKISLVTKGVSTEDFVTIQTAFDQKEYAKVVNIAMPIVEQLYLEGKENYDLTFAVGYSYLQLQLPKIALPYFTALKADYNYPQPYWYRALALLDAGDVAACTTELNALMFKFPDSKYAEAGKVLLGRLE